MKSITLFLALVIFGLTADAQTFFAFTSAANRKLHDRRLVDTVIRQSLEMPLTASTEYRWQGAFWAMELLLYKTELAKQKLTQAWETAAKRSEGFQKALLEVSYTLYPSHFNQQVLHLLNTTPSPAVFVRCAEYLLLSPNKAAFKKQIEKGLQKFRGNSYTGFSLLQGRLTPKSIDKRPSLTELFNQRFLPNQTVIYSLQRKNRNYPGLVLVRKPDGRFVRNSDGRIFHTAQLARAITNYPFYITNGNTPQGIFRWTGFDTSSSDYIGPTPNLQMVMPVEALPAVFFGDSLLATTTWSKDLYASLLPELWKNYAGLYESFYAGSIGRSEIIMHGTAINPVYYKGQSYYPQTPSLGCLCSYEEWDETGRRTISNQQKIFDALQTTKSTNGYVLVIELDDQQKPVSLDDVASYLR